MEASGVETAEVATTQTWFGTDIMITMTFNLHKKQMQDFILS
jgi:hypothetical protein